MQQKWMQSEGCCIKRIVATCWQQSAQRKTTKLKDEAGNIKSNWKDLENIVMQHSTNLFGTLATFSKKALERVREQQTTRIPQRDREVMEVPITLEELHATTLVMEKIRYLVGMVFLLSFTWPFRMKLGLCY